MALLDRFKKGRKEEKKEPVKKEEVKVAEKIKRDHPSGDHPEGDKQINPIEAEKKPATAVTKKTDKKEFSQVAARILESPHVTEKAINLNQQNKYVFKIKAGANKNEVKKSIQELYGVKVENVNVLNIPRKKRRLGRSEGFKTGFRKAVVTLAEGEKIDTGV